jgi:2-oxoglutarate dehydrogenase E1 component
MLLPHGYEGQGPEHSSARLERFMQLCAEMNMEVCVPTTPHRSSTCCVVRLSQAAQAADRHVAEVAAAPQGCCLFTLDELANGEFQRVIGEVDPIDAKKVKRVVLCCGKVYYDLLNARREKKINDIAIVRLEQLYPFPKESLEGIGQISEGDRNRLVSGRAAQPGRLVLDCFASSPGSARSAASRSCCWFPVRHPRRRPSAYLAKHNEQQKALIESALGKIEY